MKGKEDPVISKMISMPMSCAVDIAEMSKRCDKTFNATTQDVIREGIRVMRAKLGMGVQA